MIFVTVGSQKFQFNRLLVEIDLLVKKKFLKSDEIYAQTGYSTYKPKHYPYKQFLDKEQFLEAIERSTIIITHGGTGAIINSIKREKAVIGVPRMKEYGEHVDNHQIEILEQFSNSYIIYLVLDTKEMEKAIKEVNDMRFRKYQSNTKNIISILENFLEEQIE